MHATKIKKKMHSMLSKNTVSDTRNQKSLTYIFFFLLNILTEKHSVIF